MMNIAVITGASSGMGREFAKTIEQSGMTFDEVWVIARRAERLKELEGELPCKVRPISMDLTDREAHKIYTGLLEEIKPDVRLLVNCAGFGKFEATMDTPAEINQNMVDLNCVALMSMCQYTIPYMKDGSHIINIASVAAVQPIPYINVYGASKAFVLSFSRALNREVRQKGIKVTAVCPFWTKTEFFDRAIDDNKQKVVKKYVAMYEPSQIVSRAWRDMKKGKDVSKYGFKARFQMGLVKILPHSLVMTSWMKQQGLK